MAFDLTSIRRGKSCDPPRVIVYGEHKIGKSTFAAGAPDPIFITTENGIGNIDTASFPLCTSYADVSDAIGSLYSEAHSFRTVVLDSLDWLEPMVWARACATNFDKNGEPFKDIEAFGYGKGYAAAEDVFRELLSGFDALRNERGMAVILIAHCEVKRHDDPTSESFDRYQIKLHKRASAVVQEWADAIGFAAEPVIVRKQDVGFKKEVRRGVGRGERLLHLAPSPAYAAGNRYGISDSIPLTWSAFQEAIQ